MSKFGFRPDGEKKKTILLEMGQGQIYLQTPRKRRNRDEELP